PLEPMVMENRPIIKSAKVPSVMLGGVLVNRARPSPAERCWAAAMMLGLVLFGLGDRLESLRFSLFGVLLLLVNLVGSSATANLQQRALQGERRPRAGGCGEEVECLMLAQYAVSAALLLAVAALTGELGAAAAWYARQGPGAAVATLLDNVLSYAGLEGVMRITAEFDSTRANVVCSARKALTFCFSYRRRLR
ncbi:unnamed protein product, partial [Prorocentrum cordatum]